MFSIEYKFIIGINYHYLVDTPDSIRDYIRSKG